MYTSATIASTTSEIRPTRAIFVDNERRTIRVRSGRSTSRRRAIADSWASAR